MACDRHIERVLEMSTQLLEVANDDHDGCELDGCLLLDGLVRDSAMKIRQEALLLQRRLEAGRHRERATQ